MGLTPDPRMRALILSRASSAMRPGSVLDAQPKPARKRRYTGDHSQHKAWTREMMLLPGVFIPIRVSNPLNNRRHWRTVWQASKQARQATIEACRGRIPTDLPAIVTLTRYGPRSLDEGCGLNASLKPIRDGVADVFGVDDADPRYTWIYRQQKSKAYGVRVEVVHVPTLQQSIDAHQERMRKA